jgi:hypothetical protein
MKSPEEVKAADVDGWEESILAVELALTGAAGVSRPLLLLLSGCVLIDEVVRARLASFAFLLVLVLGVPFTAGLFF